MPNSQHTSSGVESSGRGLPVRRLAVGTAVLAAALLLPGVSANAQRREPAPPQSAPGLIDDQGRLHPFPAQKSFRLFAEEDLAMSGLRMTGNVGTYASNVGPCPYYTTTTPRGQCLGTVEANGSTVRQPYFEIALLAAAPPSEWRKIVQVHPGARGMLPPLGYSAPFTLYLSAPNAKRWGPGDGELGNLFSGVLTQNDGSCRDLSSFRNGSVAANFTMLAMSDCTVTWPARGFQGRRPERQDSLIVMAQRSPGTFTFEPTKIPTTAYDQTKFIGNFTTYGITSDSYREILQRFGSVTPKSSGPPTERGYPLGLDMRVDWWQYSRPSIRDVVYYEVKMVNNSQRVYGAPIDYDSLYFGLALGWLMNNQTVSVYQDFNRNALFVARGNTSGKCVTGSYPRVQIPNVTGGCIDTRAPWKWDNTGQVVMVLRSPLGDTRNKLFTKVGSPFNVPGIPDQIKDDTITFNHFHYNSFGFYYNNSFNRSDKSIFGMMASKEDDFLDGRSINDFTPAQFWLYFMNENFTGAITPAVARYNRFVPGTTIQNTSGSGANPGQPYGKWDYNNDGVQDTIYVPGCGANGCHRVWSDSIAGGFQSTFRNVGNVLSMGPFKLKAGDTASFLFAFTGGADSLNTERNADNAILAYQQFFFGPEAIPAPVFTEQDVQVTSAEVRDSLNGTQDAEIRIRIPEFSTPPDLYFNDLLRRFNDPTDRDAVRFSRIKALNPSILTQITSRAKLNYSQLLVFKSCDQGATFTTRTGSNCTPDPATNPNGTANPASFGWQPFRIINVDTVTGRLANGIVTDVVQAGRTYLYSFVTRSRGLADLPVVDSIGCRAPATTCSAAAGNVVTGPTTLARALDVEGDTINSGLLRNGPSVVQVYAPITQPAGSRLATLDTSRIAGLSNQFITGTVRGSTNSAGTFKVVFGNRFIIRTVRDTVSGRTLQVVTAQRLQARSTTTPGTVTTATTTANRVLSEETFISQGTLFPGVGTAPDSILQPTGLNPGVTFPTQSKIVPSRNKHTAQTAGAIGDTALVAGDTVHRAAVFVDTVSTGSTTTGGVAFIAGLGYILVRDNPTGYDEVLMLSFATNGTPISPPTEFELSNRFPGFALTLETAPATSTPRTINTPGGNSTTGVTITPKGDTLHPTPVTSFAVVYQAGASNRVSPGGKFKINWAGEAFGPDVPFRLTTRARVEADLKASVAKRPTVDSTRTDALTRARVDSFASSAALPDASRPLVSVKLPFTMTTPSGQPAKFAMLRRYVNAADSAIANSILLGTGPDTIRVSWPADQWRPGDTLVVFEHLTKDSTVVVSGNTITVVNPATGLPFQVEADQVAFRRFVLGCTVGSLTPSRLSCNPIALNTVGSTGYLPLGRNYRQELDFVRPFDVFSELGLSLTPATANVGSAGRQSRDKVRVVPNPFVVQSEYNQINSGRVGDPRVKFTNVPTEGVLRIYTVAGQLVQQLSWKESDLQQSCMPTSTALDAATACKTSGDLPYDLRSREGLDLGTGLYMFVLKGTGPNKKFTARGKFVVIR